MPAPGLKGPGQPRLVNYDLVSLSPVLRATCPVLPLLRNALLFLALSHLLALGVCWSSAWNGLSPGRILRVLEISFQMVHSLIAPLPVPLAIQHTQGRINLFQLCLPEHFKNTQMGEPGEGGHSAK